MAEHQRRIGNYIFTDDTGKKLYHCSSCGYKTYNLPSITNHIDKHNLVASKYQCGDCVFRCITRNQMRDHYSKQHKFSSTCFIDLSCYNRRNHKLVDQQKVALWSSNQDIEFNFMSHCLSKVKAQLYAESYRKNEINHTKGNNSLCQNQSSINFSSISAAPVVHDNKLALFTTRILHFMSDEHQIEEFHNDLCQLLTTNANQEQRVEFKQKYAVNTQGIAYLLTISTRY